MGRRVALSTEVAFVATFAGGIWGWIAVHQWDPIDRPIWWLAAGIPSLAGLVLISLVLAVPSLTQGSDLRRPLTWTLPAIHTILTTLLARAIVTGPTAAAAPPSALRASNIWLAPLSLFVLFAAQVITLEIIVRVGRKAQHASEPGSP